MFDARFCRGNYFTVCTDYNDMVPTKRINKTNNQQQHGKTRWKRKYHNCEEQILQEEMHEVKKVAIQVRE